MNRKRNIFLMLILVSLLACSSIRIGYYFADWYLESTFDDYFDLTSKQEAQVEIIVDQVHLWHKTEELPKLIILLQDFRNRVRISIHSEDIFWIQDQIQEMKIRWVERISRDISVILAQLHPEQIEHFAIQLKEHNHGHSPENQMTQDEWEEKRVTNLFDELSDWFGDFTIEQKFSLLEVYDLDRVSYLKHLKENQVLQQKFIDLLNKRLAAEDLEPVITEWFLQLTSEDSGNNESLNANRNQKMIHFFLTLDQILTEKQRQYFLKKIDGYIEDLTIICQST